MLQSFRVHQTALQKLVMLLAADILMLQQCFHTYLYGCHRGFQFVVYIVGKLFLYPFLIKLLMQGIVVPYFRA